MKLPVIDISSFLDQRQQNKSCEEKQLETAKEIRHACIESGFFYLIGHGLHGNEMRVIRDAAKQFFELPQQEKDEISISKGDFARGYQKLGQNITQYAQDWHEGLDLYAPVGENHIIRQRGLKTLSGDNPYPKSLENFKGIVDDYVLKMRKLGRTTMKAIAMGLELDKDYFDSFMDDSFWVMRMIGYPPLKESNSKDVGISCGEHTDYGCLTLLNTDETTGALQVLAKDGTWINADPIENAFVVNIGDMLNNWTNDIYKSTLHRVIHTKSSYRISVPFFFEPNFNAVIEPLPGCVKESGKPPLYKPIMYGDHLLSKVTNNFDVGESK